MKGQIFRIAHLGYFDYMDTVALIAALEQVVHTSLPQLAAPLGAGLIAAQTLFADRPPFAVLHSACICGRTDACCSLQHPSSGSHTENDNVDATGLDPRTQHVTAGA